VRRVQAFCAGGSPGTWRQLGAEVRGGSWGGPWVLRQCEHPCGVAVLLDVPTLRLMHLDIQGLLRSADQEA